MLTLCLTKHALLLSSGSTLLKCWSLQVMNSVHINFFKNLCYLLMKCKILIKQAVFVKLQYYVFNIILEIVFLKAVSPIRSLGCIQHPDPFIWFMHFSEKAEKFNGVVFFLLCVMLVIPFIIYGHSQIVKFIFMM